jgi:Na+/H+ antiporter NhaD/arsenite permease-like protein
MLGLQEILIISAIVVGAIFLPRMVNQNKPAPRRVRPQKKLSGKGRLAIAATIVFPLVMAALLQPWHNDPITFLYICVGPVMLCWLLFWVWQGYRRP